MSSPFVGEIRCFGFNFAPINWAFCNGQLMAISQNTALYSILGTTYGGDGVTTFGMPNLQGNVPMHWGNLAGFNTVIGQTMGTTNWTLTTAQTPAHNHAITVQEFPVGGDQKLKTAQPNSGSWLSGSNPGGLWNNNPSPNLNAQFSQQVLSPVGGSQPHENMQPFLVLNFCICLFGVYPSQN